MKHVVNEVRVFFLLAIAILVFTACESYQTVSLVVKDSETLLPLDSVYVQVKAGKNGDYTKSGCFGYTDSLGNYSCSFMIGCAGGCYDIYMECSKHGYENYVSEINVIESVVLLHSLPVDSTP